MLQQACLISYGLSIKEQNSYDAILSFIDCSKPAIVFESTQRVIQPAVLMAALKKISIFESKNTYEVGSDYPSRKHLELQFPSKNYRCNMCSKRINQKRRIKTKKSQWFI